MTIDVTPVNDPPTSTGNTVVTNEDVAHPFAAADFTFADVDSGDSLTQVQITALPAIGALELFGVAVVPDQIIALAEIVAGNLEFVPLPDGNGSGYDSFNYKVHDGTTFSLSDATMTIDVTPVNDPPTSTGNTVVTDEDVAHPFAAADFTFADVDSGDSLTQVQITALPAVGALELSGVAVVPDQIIALAEIVAGNLEFVPLPDGNGSGYDSFNYKVHDGTTFSLSDATMTINVTPVNDPPTSTGNTVVTDEDVAHPFAAADFTFADVDSGDSLTQVQITALPAVGALELSGVAVVPDQIIALAEIVAGNLEFVPLPDGNGSGYDSFNYKVHDGTTFSLSDATMTINVTPVNDPPTATPNENTIAEETSTPVAGNVITDDDGFGVDSDPDVNDTLNVSDFDGESIPGNDVNGDYGTVDWDEDGSYEYLLDNANPSVQAIGIGETLFDVFSYTVTDGSATSTATLTITITGRDDPHLRTGVVSGVTDAWKTVTLDRIYASMVVVATPNYDSTSVPLVTRLQNAESGNSFDVRVQSADGLGGSVGPVDVHYMVVEEGTYTVANHGVKMEAHKFLSTVTDGYASWPAESRGYSNGSYATPVVVGQVMTDQPGSDFSVFWSRGGSRGAPPSSTSLFVGKHVGEDPNQTRPDETIGYIVVEAGSGLIDSLEYAADVGADTVRGMAPSPPYTYSINGPASPLSAIASQVAMDGTNGGWAALYGPNAVTSTSLNLVIDEDQVADAERSHTTEQVAFIVFGTGNQAPVNSVPGPQNTQEDTPLTFSSAAVNAISIADADAGGNLVQVTLDASHGLLTLNGTAGLSFTTGNGTDDPTMTFTGTTSQVNFALDGMTFEPTADFNGESNLTVHTDDLGNTGSGGPRSDSDVISITIDAVNDAPVNIVPALQNIDEDTSLVFSVANGNAISVTDVDAGGAPILIVLSATNGTITLGSTAGLNFIVGDGSADASMTFTAPLAAVNAAFADLAFDPLPEFSGIAGLEVSSNDLGNTGGDQLIATDVVDIVIAAVNDAPVISVPGPQYIPVDTVLEFVTDTNPIVVSDVDAGAGNLEVTISVSNGTLTLSGNNGLTFTDGDGTDDSLMVFRGRLSDINIALDGMIFEPPIGFSGLATLQISVDDLGNTGPGATGTDLQTVDISVDAPLASPLASQPLESPVWARWTGLRRRFGRNNAS